MTPLTYILRHRKENLRKCSLTGLETREDLRFYTYPTDLLPPLGEVTLLSLEGPTLSPIDSARPLFLVDGTWKYAEKMTKMLPTHTTWIPRTLPSCYRTAYPRSQTSCPEQERGLASIEALFLAYILLGKDPRGLLDHYYWKKQFLDINREN